MNKKKCLPLILSHENDIKIKQGYFYVYELLNKKLISQTIPFLR